LIHGDVALKMGPDYTHYSSPPRMCNAALNLAKF
jgi:hypothetical protein